MTYLEQTTCKNIATELRRIANKVAEFEKNWADGHNDQARFRIDCASQINNTIKPELSTVECSLALLATVLEQPL